ncbi:MAG: 30S ribosomal protein S6 [Patescibacteria group bacterium]
MSKEEKTVDQEIETDLAESKNYEIGFLLLPLVAEADLVKVLEEEIINPITKAGGEVLSRLNPSIITLAYPIRHVVGHDSASYKDAYFGAVQFSLNPAQVEALSLIWKNSDKLLRFLLLVVPDSLIGKISPGKVASATEEAITSPSVAEEPKPAPDQEKETKPAEPLDTESIDEQIEGLLTENKDETPA